MENGTEFVVNLDAWVGLIGTLGGVAAGYWLGLKGDSKRWKLTVKREIKAAVRTVSAEVAAWDQSLTKPERDRIYESVSLLLPVWYRLIGFLNDDEELSKHLLAHYLVREFIAKDGAAVQTDLYQEALDGLRGLQQA